MVPGKSFEQKDEEALHVAISHADDVIAQCEADGNDSCKNDHLQLKSWLNELIKLRKKKPEKKTVNLKIKTWEEMARECGAEGHFTLNNGFTLSMEAAMPPDRIIECTPYKDGTYKWTRDGDRSVWWIIPDAVANIMTT